MKSSLFVLGSIVTCGPISGQPHCCKWALEVVTFIIDNVFEHNVIILVKEGGVSYVSFISNCYIFNRKWTKMQQFRNYPLCFHGN